MCFFKNYMTYISVVFLRLREMLILSEYLNKKCKNEFSIKSELIKVYANIIECSSLPN